jgi:hypothetical protein
VKGDNGDLLAYSPKFSWLLNAHNVGDVRQIEVHTYESLVPCPSCLEVEIAIYIIR